MATIIHFDRDKHTMVEFDYIVTQVEAEGPERMMYREYVETQPGIWELAEYGWSAWGERIEEDEPPAEVMTHFFGPIVCGDEH